MTRKIRKVTVLGSGIMGSRIACHFANIGLEVLLLDIVTPDLPKESKKNERDILVNKALDSALKSNPSPIFSKRFIRNIKTGNFEDDLDKIADEKYSELLRDQENKLKIEQEKQKQLFDKEMEEKTVEMRKKAQEFA